MYLPCLAALRVHTLLRLAAAARGAGAVLVLKTKSLRGRGGGGLPRGGGRGCCGGHGVSWLRIIGWLGRAGDAVNPIGPVTDGALRELISKR